MKEYLYTTVKISLGFIRSKEQNAKCSLDENSLFKLLLDGLSGSNMDFSALQYFYLVSCSNGPSIWECTT